MLKYLHLDCEMGSGDLSSSLLTSYFMVTDDKFNVIDTLYLQTKPDDGIYILSGQGMIVNKINIQEHDKIAIPYKQAKPLLFNFLKQHSSSCRLTPVGHGVLGDIRHVKDKLISSGSWEQFCSYHFIDTSVVLQFLRVCGKMPMDTDGSVEALSKYFNIVQFAGEYHNAEFDVRMTAKILEKMIGLI